MNSNCRFVSLHLRSRSNILLLNYYSRGNQFFHSFSHKVPLSLCQQCLHQSKHVTKLRGVTYGSRFLLLPARTINLTQLQRLFSTKLSGPTKSVSKKVFYSKGTPIRQEMRRLLSLAKAEKWNLTGAVLLLLFSSAITMSVPFALGKVIDLIYTADPTKMKENLDKLTAILFVIFLIGGACNFGRVYLMNISAQRITRTLREKVFNAIMMQEVGFFDNNKTGELVNRLSADTSLVSNCVTMNISDGLRSFIMVIAGISMMFYMSAELALVSLCIVPPVAVLAILYGRFMRRMTVKVQDALAEATQVAEERIANIRTVKAFSKETEEMDRYKNRMQHILDLATKESLARGIFFGMAGLSGNAIVLCVLYYGGSMVSGHSLTVGDLSAFLLYAAYIGVSLGGLTSFYSELNRGLGASTRLWQLIDREPLIPVRGGVEPTWEPAGNVHFEDVLFFYPGRTELPVLKGLSLIVPPATVTAVVGASGSGKSTLAALLLRLYDPQSGKVTLDNLSVAEYNPAWLRSHIGTVSQEPVLFSGTIRENVLYGASDPENVSEERILEAMREANAYNFVKELPQGMETLVGERGVMLSGGQKQRIAIARALIKNPKILLLDEATSALDAESEHLVQEALERIMKGRTVLTIAHRLSTIKNADQIAVLDNGQIVELGSYEQLMENKNGAFRKLVKHQTFQEE